MRNCYLAIEINHNSFEFIVLGYQKDNNIYNASMEEIDSITSQFVDEKSFIDFVRENFLADIENSQGKVVIITYTSDGKQIVEKSVAYNNISFLINLDYLKDFIKNNSGNYSLINETVIMVASRYLNKKYAEEYEGQWAQKIIELMPKIKENDYSVLDYLQYIPYQYLRQMIMIIDEKVLETSLNNVSVIKQFVYDNYDDFKQINEIINPVLHDVLDDDEIAFEDKQFIYDIMALLPNVVGENFEVLPYFDKIPAKYIKKIIQKINLRRRTQLKVEDKNNSNYVKHLKAYKNVA